VTAAAAPARAAAARVLERVETGRALADRALEQALSRGVFAPRDAALVTELVLGTLRWQRALDWRLAPHSRRPLERLDPPVRVLLRMTAYQLLFLERVPAFAAIDDAVTLARARGPRGAAGFVNAVLRSLATAAAREPAPADDPIEALATRGSCPTWLARRWTARYGREDAARLMAAMNERPPLTLRANTLRLPREALRERLLREEGIETRAGRWAPEALIVERGGGSPAAWRAFVEGALAVQDEASMLVAHLLGARPGETVADVCAAPGTKATHLAQLMGDRGRVIALDASAARIALVDEAARRLGLTIVETRAGAVETLAPDLGETCDRVLVDAPCTSLGVLRRRPDAKWRRGPGDLADAARRQASILDAAATLVRPDGTLVYATCSLEPEENEDVVAAFLGTHPGFRSDPPDDFPLALGTDGVLRCLPHRHGTDGFTAVRLRRRL
jgi:16S rRNA (cytosine967-C5)-methyltransferase